MLQHGAPFKRTEAIQKATNAQVARNKFWADLRRDGSVREVECQFRTFRGTVHTVLALR